MPPVCVDVNVRPKTLFAHLAEYGRAGCARSVRASALAVVLGKTITQFFVCQIKLLKFTTAVLAVPAQHSMRRAISLLIQASSTTRSRRQRLLILLQHTLDNYWTGFSTHHTHTITILLLFAACGRQPHETRDGGWRRRRRRPRFDVPTGLADTNASAQPLCCNYRGKTPCSIGPWRKNMQTDTNTNTHREKER